MEPQDARERLQAQGWEYVENEEGGVVWQVQRNVTAKQAYTDHQVEWWMDEETEVSEEDGRGDGKGFLEKLQPGDVIALWARALVSGLRR